MMLKNSQQKNCGEMGYHPLISYVVAFLVKMLVQQENEKDLQTKKEITRDRGYGLNIAGLLAKLSQNGLWLKMYGGYCQQNLWEEQGEIFQLFCETWPKWGMMRHGVVTELQMPAHHINGKECSLWPTPDCSDRRSMKSKQQGLSNQVKLWPTPRVGDISGGDRTKWAKEGKWQTGLREAVNINNWPTPRAGDSLKRGNVSNDPRNGLPGAVKWPTPTVCMAKGASEFTIRKDGKNRCNDRLDYAVYTGVGQLNPDWVEILMGLSIGWTDIDCDTPALWQGWPAPINMSPYGYEPSRVTTVSKNRANRLKALGNGCVPQQIYWIFKAIVDIEKKAINYKKTTNLRM